MRKDICRLLLLLFALAAGWLIWSAESLGTLVRSAPGTGLLGVAILYGLSHLLRLFRLAILALPQRNRLLPLMAAHLLTAFPSSFLPFKLGEFLRLGAFCHALGSRRGALAVWLTERLGDIVVITVVIGGLYVFQVSIPAPMRALLTVFLLASSVAVFVLLAITTSSSYLNRYLVLVSHSARGLTLLKLSRSLQQLEQHVRQSVEGRVLAFLLLSILIWCAEIFALFVFMQQLSISVADFPSLFGSVLLNGVSSEILAHATEHKLYQSALLAALALVCVIAVGIWQMMNKMAPTDVRRYS